jgi:hypothetical protein
MTKVAYGDKVKILGYLLLRCTSPSTDADFDALTSIPIAVGAVLFAEILTRARRIPED